MFLLKEILFGFNDLFEGFLSFFKAFLIGKRSVFVKGNPIRFQGLFKGETYDFVTFFRGPYRFQ